MQLGDLEKVLRTRWLRLLVQKLNPRGHGRGHGLPRKTLSGAIHLVECLTETHPSDQIKYKSNSDVDANADTHVDADDADADDGHSCCLRHPSSCFCLLWWKWIDSSPANQ